MGTYSDTEVFIDPPIFVAPQPKRRGRGRPRKRSKLIKTNPLSIKISKIGENVEEDAWEHLELRHDSRGKPLVVEASVSASLAGPRIPERNYSRRGVVDHRKA
ncbi:MAG: hypothetical protein JRI22_00255 [Deltaproteobacteria bacterium]|nr:hypothetical protein [Deltaproteobacteria bacterium]